MSITGGYASMAEAVGETAWQRGECPPPSVTYSMAELNEMHPDDYDAAMAAMDVDTHRNIAWYERRNREQAQEIARLKAEIAGEEPGNEDAWLDAAYEDRWDSGE